ncbi:MAG TPA: hypothetical protein VED20_03310 [Streptosporangiaceae bacterium]|nr:hypothetical protein [Streptosporangiaceae bacterium]
MTRIYRRTIADAPEASGPLLEGYVASSPTGKVLNLHGQMALSPLVLAVFTAYFVNYASTPIDLPAGPGSAAAGVAGSGTGPATGSAAAADDRE